MMCRMTGIVIALVEVLLPFMVLALDAAPLNIDRQLYAARNLGAGATRIFLQITLPLSLPGIISGSLLVFILAISAFVTPALIGGPRIPVMSTLIHQQGISLLNWPSAIMTNDLHPGTSMPLKGRHPSVLNVTRT